VAGEPAELRRERPWGPRRITLELGRRRVVPLPSESAVYRRLVRAGVIDPDLLRRRGGSFPRWERTRSMELWQMDVVDGRTAGRVATDEYSRRGRSDGHDGDPHP
jgi:hypothetical protein